MKDIKLEIQGGPAGLSEAIEQSLDSFAWQANTPQTRSLIQHKITEIMRQFGVDDLALEGVRVESDPADPTRVIVRNKTADAQDIQQAIQNLEREIMGDDGWWRDPTYGIERLVASYPDLPLKTIMDILESGISIGVSQYGG